MEHWKVSSKLGGGLGEKYGLISKDQSHSQCEMRFEGGFVDNNKEDKKDDRKYDDSGNRDKEGSDIRLEKIKREVLEKTLLLVFC